MTEQPTPYDAVAYPAWIYPETEPSRLAAIARLHGLAAPDPAMARVLEVAGGDGLNMVAMAAAWPRARFHSFDLAPTAVARGARLAEAAGLGNVRITVDDLLDAAETLAGPYDYIIVHGLYAWVPEVVREATLRLIGRVLAPQGISFVSYNAKPGSYLRNAIRDMLLHHVEGVADPQERLSRVFALLEDYVQPKPGDSPAVAALRWTAGPILQRMPGALFHDEMGDIYAPQSLTEVTDAAARHGLAFLNDASPFMIYDGLPGGEVAEDEVVRLAQADDYRAATFFHQTLLVRPGRAPRRGLVAGCLDDLWLGAAAQRTGPGEFTGSGRSVEISDPDLAEFLDLAAQRSPERLALRPIATTLERCEDIVRLANAGLVVLHAAPAPFAAVAGERPLASPLARAQVAEGTVGLISLDLKGVAFADPGPRAFLALLDGTRDRAGLERDWAASGHGHEVPVAAALDHFAKAGMLLDADR
ncbi:methyltransferase domain-containing protein [Novosphingobium bradum]|uniref:Methyltransferase domain-containing protein n=1 Tax=Novosphingobium bradum TaxID=1737444 RepID=A0ABV7IRK3_9SPHN